MKGSPMYLEKGQEPTGYHVQTARRVACLLALIAPCGVSVSIPKNQKTQHGVEALDGGDADAADLVELRRFQVLDVVKLGELAAVVGRDELLEFFQGLVAEIAAVDEEEDAPRAGELDEAVNEIDGGVGLAAASGHLNEGAAFVGGEGFLEIADRFDLRGPEIACGHLIQSRNVRETFSCLSGSSHSSNVSGRWNAKTLRLFGIGSS